MKKVLLLAIAGLFLVACGNCGNKKTEKENVATETKAGCEGNCNECGGCNSEEKECGETAGCCDSTKTE
jgi:hypothetical protein